MVKKKKKSFPSLVICQRDIRVNLKELQWPKQEHFEQWNKQLDYNLFKKKQEPQMESFPSLPPHGSTPRFKHHFTLSQKCDLSEVNLKFPDQQDEVICRHDKKPVFPSS